MNRKLLEFHEYVKDLSLSDTVMRMDDKRVAKIRIQKISEEEAENE